MSLKTRSTNYQKMWVSFSVLVTAMMLATCMLCYHAFDRRFALEVEQAQLNAIAYEKNVLVSQVVTRANELAQKLSLDGNYAQVFRKLMTDVSGTVVLTAWDTIRDFSALNRDVLSWVAVYYPQEHFLISDVAGYKQLNHRSNESYQKLVETIQPIQVGKGSWILMERGTVPEIEDRLMFCFTPVWHADTLTESPCILFVIRESCIRSTLQTMTAKRQRASLLDREGHILFTAGNTQLSMESMTSEILLRSLEDTIYTYGDRAQRLVHTVCPVADTPFCLVISTPAEIWYGETADILRLICAVGIGLLGVSLVFVVLISKRLYAPLQMLAVVAQQSSSVPSQARRDEYRMIQSALDELSYLLSNTKRVLHTNRSLLKNQALNEWIQQNNPEMARETLEYLGLTFPHSSFCLVAVEYSAKDALRLLPETRQAVPVAVTELVENHFSSGDCRAYGWLPRPHIVAFVFNFAGELQTQALQEMIGSFFDCQDTRYYLVRSSIFTEESVSIRKNYERLLSLLDCRMYDTRRESIHTQPLNGSDVVGAQTLLEQINGMEAGWQWESLKQRLNELLEQISHMHPEKAYLYLSQAMASLRTLLLSAYPERPLPQALLDPHTHLWNIVELSECLENHFAPEEETITEDVILLRQVKQYVCDHLAEDLSLESVAEALHFNPKYFSRKFRNTTNMTLTNYITMLRLEKASILLRRSTDSVEQIASSVGYNSSQYFIRKFKECYGVTPSEFRKG